MLDCLIVQSLSGENGNTSGVDVSKKGFLLNLPFCFTLFPTIMVAFVKKGGNERDLKLKRPLTAVSTKFLSGGLGSDFERSIRLAPTLPPRPAPILEGNIFRLGRFLRFARFSARTCVPSFRRRSFLGMSPLTPTSQNNRHADPSDLLFLALRFASSAYLASERFVATRQRPEPEPPAALHAVPRRTPPLLVGQALDRMAA